MNYPEFITHRQWASFCAGYFNALYELSRGYLLDTVEDIDQDKGFEIDSDSIYAQEKELVEFLARVNWDVAFEPDFWKRLSDREMSDMGNAFYLARDRYDRFNISAFVSAANEIVNKLIDRDFSEVNVWLADGDNPGEYRYNEYGEYLICVETYVPHTRLQYEIN